MLDLPTAPVRNAAVEHAADEQRILARLSARDADALGELAERWEGRVHAFVARACGPAACDAVVEDVFWRAWQDAPARTWSNGTADWLRRLVWEACRAHLAAQASAAPAAPAGSRSAGSAGRAIPQHV